MLHAEHEALSAQGQENRQQQHSLLRKAQSTAHAAVRQGHEEADEVSD